MRILGVDPGSRKTGYGLIEFRRQKMIRIASGCLTLGSGDMSQRLAGIFEGISGLCDEHQPDVAAVESVFVKLNVSSAIKLGQARGAAICAIATHAVPISEYSPAKVKQTIVGGGRADKGQVGFMVRRLLGCREELQEDEADALAIAICHAHHGSVRA